jgi:methyl-accepting chemotaxis protein
MPIWLKQFIQLFLLRVPSGNKASADKGVEDRHREPGEVVEVADDQRIPPGLPAEEAARLSAEVAHSTSALQQTCSRVEDDFLKMGEQLQSVYAQAGQMTRAAQEALSFIGTDADQSVLSTITRTASRALADLDPEQSRIADRLQNIGSICNCLHKLHPLTGNLNRIAKVLKIVATNINIESCRAGEYQEDFAVLSQEIRTLSNTVATLARTLRDEIQTTAEELERMQAAMQTKLSRFSQVADDARHMVARVAPQCQALMADSVGAFQRVSADAEAISASIGQIVVSLQIHDNVSQRVEHVVEALADVRLSLQPLEDDSPNKAISADPMPAIDANLELQEAQLENIIADIDRVFQESGHAFSTIGDYIHDVVAGILKIAWGQSSADANHSIEAGSVGALQTVLEKIRELVGQGDQTIEELMTIGHNATEAVARIGAQVERVKDVNFDIRLKALNAIFKSTHLGGQGRAIGALVQEMKDLAEQSNHLVEQIESLRGAIMDQSDQMQARSQAEVGDDQEGALVNVAELDLAIRNYAEAGANLTGKADEMTRLGHTIDAAVLAAADQLAFLIPFTGELRTHQKQLNACRTQMTPWMISGGDTTGLDKARLSGRYTMQQERNIHASILDLKTDGLAGEAVTESAAGPDDSCDEMACKDADQSNLGDNVELF